MEFKERLKCLRKEKGLTQSNLAQILNYGYTAISNYESGRNEPSITDLKKIASFFNVSMDYLLCINDNRNPYIEDSFPEKFEKFRNIFNLLDVNSRDELSLFMDWLIEKQNKSNSVRKYKVAQNILPYKTKQED